MKPLSFKLYYWFFFITLFTACGDNSTNSDADELKGRDTQTPVVTVTNQETGRTWMDRNLGASRVAISSSDEEAYGDLYQWGRLSDGHQERNSNTTNTLSSDNIPGHSDFIISTEEPSDWRSPQNNDLWQGNENINNPCPIGFRIPTKEEWEAERESWGENDVDGAFSSILKLPAVSIRLGREGSFSSSGLVFYWSSSINEDVSNILFISGNTSVIGSSIRANGLPVRCIQES